MKVFFVSVETDVQPRPFKRFCGEELDDVPDEEPYQHRRSITDCLLEILILL